MFTSALLTFRARQFFVGGGLVSSILVLHPLDTSTVACFSTCCDKQKCFQVLPNHPLIDNHWFIIHCQLPQLKCKLREGRDPCLFVYCGFPGTQNNMGMEYMNIWMNEWINYLINTYLNIWIHSKHKCQIPLLGSGPYLILSLFYGFSSQ